MLEETFKQIDEDFLELCITKGIMNDKSFALLVVNGFDESFFKSPYLTTLYNNIKRHLNEYNVLPSTDIILSTINGDQKDMVKDYINESTCIDFEISKNYDWLLESTDFYLKDKAIKQAIMDSVDIIKSKENILTIRKIVEDALCKNLKINLGLDYFGMLGERLERIFNATDIRIPTGFANIDEIINGGIPPLTLSVWAAVIHGGKSLLLANMISRQILLGYNPILFTLEMSEDAFAQRFDSIFSGYDTNRMYIRKDLKGKLLQSLISLKGKEERGNLWIKEMATGQASVNDFRMYLRELKMRDQKIDCVFCDYINLMKPQYKSKGSMYEDIKSISIDLRALSFEFKVPVVSVTQLNREGSTIDLKNLNFNYIAESIALAATCDFIGILGHDEDSLFYESELHFKVVKNRFGRAGQIGKLFMDKRSLKLYDENELDMWLNDAKRSGDDRNAYEG